MDNSRVSNHLIASTCAIPYLHNWTAMPQNVYVSSVSSVDITDARAIHLGFDNVIYLRNR